MRTPEEVRARVEFMKNLMGRPGTKKSLGPLLLAAEDAMLWVIGENDDANMSMQANYDAMAAKELA